MPEQPEIGRTICEAIGTSLTNSGVLDSLVPRGKGPDIDVVYIYNHQYVWKKDAKFFYRQTDVVPGQRRVHKVRRGERGAGYEFEFVEEPGVAYTCNYGWALVPDTRANVDLLAHYDCLQEQAKKLQAHAGAILRYISLDEEE